MSTLSIKYPSTDKDFPSKRGGLLYIVVSTTGHEAHFSKIIKSASSVTWVYRISAHDVDELLYEVDKYLEDNNLDWEITIEE